ncbi:hypothetical protein BQ6471_00892 [Vibrio gazogenes]|nr:hypothetical protein BQ6471_00892 [Vibrio gazogenes]
MVALQKQSSVIELNTTSPDDFAEAQYAQLNMSDWLR